MLIEFSVSNFRSFRERQTLSMVAAAGLGKESNVFAASVDGEELPDLLKVAAVYGPKWQSSSQSLIAHQFDFTTEVVALLRDNDIPVTAIRRDSVTPQLGLRLTPTDQTTLTLKTALGEAEFDFSEESDGTKNLIGFAFPWSLLRTNDEHFFSVLFVDEFDSSLHPDIVATMVRKHIESEPPRQLIFTTHDTHFMTTKLLRRDQFWLTERGANGATQLRAIHVFEGSEDEDIEKRYFEGRYRALPLVRRC